MLWSVAIIPQPHTYSASSIIQFLSWVNFHNLYSIFSMMKNDYSFWLSKNEEDHWKYHVKCAAKNILINYSSFLHAIKTGNISVLFSVSTLR